MFIFRLVISHRKDLISSFRSPSLDDDYRIINEIFHFIATRGIGEARYQRRRGNWGRNSFQHSRVSELGCVLTLAPEKLGFSDTAIGIPPRQPVRC